MRQPSSKTSPLDSPADWPHIVVLCGSTRFWNELQEANARETAAGHIVLAPGCDMKHPHALWETAAQAEVLKPKLDRLHRQKILLADEVVVVAPGGYIGASTRAEIDYADELGRPVRYAHPPTTAPAPPRTDATAPQPEGSTRQ
ncbi:hypothetical protein ACH4SP_12335 [Streptomyces sp. NPDC021093]|uniref:hypothetical protein n=1 Tax=Streptomyces sp. NPDC021093 TaxID=3365112 RepID=UPI0037905EDD